LTYLHTFKNLENLEIQLKQITQIPIKKNPETPSGSTHKKLGKSEKTYNTLRFYQNRSTTQAEPINATKPKTQGVT